MPTTNVTGAARATSVAAALLLSLAVAGCGTSSGTAGAPKVALSPTGLASQVALVDGDLHNGATVSLIPRGDQVKGQVTLDNCGYVFSTEKHRVARLQLEILTAKGEQTGGTNEVAVYDSAAQAAKALTEFRKSVTGCKKNVFHKSTVKGVPDLRYVATITTSASLPVKDNAVAIMTLTPKGSKRHLYGELIFQRQGTVLSGIYVQSTTKLTKTDLAAGLVLAAATGKRLAAI